MHCDLLNQNTNSVVTGLLENTPHLVVNKLGELLKERGNVARRFKLFDWYSGSNNK